MAANSSAQPGGFVGFGVMTDDLVGGDLKQFRCAPLLVPVAPALSQPRAWAMAPTRFHGSGREPTSKPARTGHTASIAPPAGAGALYREKVGLSALPPWPRNLSPPGRAYLGLVEEKALSIASSRSD